MLHMLGVNYEHLSNKRFVCTFGGSFSELPRQKFANCSDLVRCKLHTPLVEILSFLWFRAMNSVVVEYELEDSL